MIHPNKDYCIFRIDYFADSRLLRNAHAKGGPPPKQHYDRAKDYSVFISKFIEDLTGKNFEFWFRNYLEPRLCAFEEIREKTGIVCTEDSGKLYILVPLDQTDMIESIRKMKNILPKKELKRFPFTNMWSVWNNRDPETFRKLYKHKSKIGA